MESTERLFVGVGQVTLYIRHARSLKDKRQIMKSLRQKLNNRGFSTVECSSESIKQGTLGYALIGARRSEIEDTLHEIQNLFFGNFEVTRRQFDVLDYGFLSENNGIDHDKYGEEE